MSEESIQSFVASFGHLSAFASVNGNWLRAELYCLLMQNLYMCTLDSQGQYKISPNRGNNTYFVGLL